MTVWGFVHYLESLSLGEDLARAILEVDPTVPVEPSDDYNPNIHLNYNYRRDPGPDRTT